MENALSFSLVAFLIGTFAAAFVTGVAGFAFGLVAAAIWLHALNPLQTTALIVAYALLVQSYAVWRLRHALDWRRLAPFIVGSAIGIPLGAAGLNFTAPSSIRIGVGALLIGFSAYSLARPQLPQLKRDAPLADAGAGFLNGVVGGATGLAGILLVIWCAMRGWSRDEQRAVFQPTAVASFLLTLLWFGGTGRISYDTVRLFVVGLPVLIAGTWLGWKAYGYLDETRFRQLVLILLLISGLFLALT